MRRLKLNRETLRQLGLSQLADVAAGIIFIPVSPPPDDTGPTGGGCPRPESRMRTCPTNVAC